MALKKRIASKRSATKKKGKNSVTGNRKVSGTASRRKGSRNKKSASAEIATRPSPERNPKLSSKVSAKKKGVVAKKKTAPRSQFALETLTNTRKQIRSFEKRLAGGKVNSPAEAIEVKGVNEGDTPHGILANIQSSPKKWGHAPKTISPHGVDIP